jgi:hypothetical protein
MLNREDLRQCLEYNYRYDDLKKHVRTYLTQQQKPCDNEAVIETIIESAMQLYHTCKPANREALGMDRDPEVVLNMIAKNKNSRFALSPSATGSSSGGCYVATCVYGSYDCPEVWTLRRFRDDTLGSTWYGRAFIHTYYAVSPTLVKWFGETNWFKKMWRGTLDRMVHNLRDHGVADTPYEDKHW